MTRRYLVAAVTCLTLAGTQALLAQDDEAERVRKAATVLEEIMKAPDKAIPDSVIKKAEAIAVFPGTLKGGFGVGGHHDAAWFQCRREPLDQIGRVPIAAEELHGDDRISARRLETGAVGGRQPR